MKTITYAFSDGHKEELEVADEVAEVKPTEFNFLVYVNNDELNKVMFEKDLSFETLVLLNRRQVKEV